MEKWIDFVDTAVILHQQEGVSTTADVANPLPILYLLTLVAEQEISHEDVTFLFGDKTIKPNEYGAIIDWPPGFCDAEDHLASRRLRAQVRRRREKVQTTAMFSDNRDKHDEE